MRAAHALRRQRRAALGSGSEHRVQNDVLHAGRGGRVDEARVAVEAVLHARVARERHDLLATCDAEQHRVHVVEERRNTTGIETGETVRGPATGMQQLLALLLLLRRHREEEVDRTTGLGRVRTSARPA